MTRFPVTALRSVAIGTPDSGAVGALLYTTWGLDLAAREDGAVYLRRVPEPITTCWRSTGADKPAIFSVTFRVASLEISRDRR